ncbi:helix-turn-helix transcriptional regulator [Phytoactinopolyspora limicola]|uniref:helix-turn-helix transcriptional regulator n=1 Tax=Phytoactinopolyspora limicola TaxID=2715536 RepID=UPI00140E7FB3|nr:LuxR family transcriptional regulator [Phytoactinopolyspora limicola]
MFESLGLSRESESVYLAMLQLSDVGIHDLAGQLHLDVSRVRAAMDELARLSLLRPSVFDPATFRPVPPEAGLRSLLARQEAEIASRHEQLNECKAAIATLLAEHADLCTDGRDTDIEYVQGNDAVRDRVKLLASECEWESSSLMSGGAQSVASLRAGRELGADAIGRGVRLRTIYLDSACNDQATLEYVRWLNELGSEVRTAPSLPLRMLIVDRDRALIPADPEGGEATAMFISSKGILRALVALFSSVWKSARPLGAPRRPCEEGLSVQQREVIKLLAQGLTDEAVARRLGVSVRTSRRAASELLAGLDAGSRFQAGARAVARGWLDADDLD